jgi:hypothetical protein
MLHFHEYLGKLSNIWCVIPRLPFPFNVPSDLKLKPNFTQRRNQHSRVIRSRQVSIRKALAKNTRRVAGSRPSIIETTHVKAQKVPKPQDRASTHGPKIYARDRAGF